MYNKKKKEIFWRHHRSVFLLSSSRKRWQQLGFYSDFLRKQSFHTHSAQTSCTSWHSFLSSNFLIQPNRSIEISKIWRVKNTSWKQAAGQRRPTDQHAHGHALVSFSHTESKQPQETRFQYWSRSRNDLLGDVLLKPIHLFPFQQGLRVLNSLFFLAITY